MTALPYSCIEACDLSTEGKNEYILFGASGPKLVAQSSSGARSVWPREVESTKAEESVSETEERPGKRVRLSSPEEKPADKPTPEKQANFSSLTLTPDKKHLVAVTAEDKCIRVFEIDANAQLNQLSERCMSRRPCEIAITSDGSDTILCADKFGDVYALPLVPGPNDVQETPIEEEDAPYVPAATVLTVHSGHNRKVLEEQLKQKAKGPKKTKEAPSFKHELLLGHVSMLTDIAYTTVEGRSYIITADRDEHIRVSRGPPQAHIIEGFCHGHESFVNRMCLTKSGLLVSGGGDPFLFVWEWLKGQLQQQLPIRDVVYQYLKAQPDLASNLPETQESFKVAVTGLWSVPCAANDEIFVACEGVPALFRFTLGSSPSSGVVALSGNALDVTFMKSTQAVVSIDNAHAPGSTTDMRKDECPYRLQFFSYRQDGEWEEDVAAGQPFEWFSREAGKTDKLTADDKAIRDIIYGIENLRKRPGSED